MAIINQIPGDSRIKDTYGTIYDNDYNMNQEIIGLRGDYDSHVGGSDDKHGTNAILNNSLYSEVTLTAVLNLIKATIESHFNATSDRHGSDDIDNDSTVGDGGSGDLSGVMESLQSQITAIVAGGAEVDPRLSQALIDFENTDWTALGFKALQDFWQERIVELEKYYTDATVPPISVTNTSPTISFDVNNGGITPIISGSGSTITNSVVGFESGEWEAVGDPDVFDISNGVLHIFDGTHTTGGRYYPNLSSNDKLFIYGLVKGSDAQLRMYSPLFMIGSTNNSGDFSEMYGIAQDDWSDASYLYLRTLANNDAYFKNIILVNMTALGIEDYTEQQMLDIVRQGYIKGTQNLTDLKFDVRGENLFNPSEVTLNKRLVITGSLADTDDSYVSDYIPVIGGVEYKVANSGGDSRNVIVYFDRNKNAVSDGFTSQQIIPPVDGYIRFGGYTTGLETQQLVEGTTTPSEYIEPFHNEIYASVTLTSKDNYTVEGGKMVVDRNVRVIESLDGIDYTWSAVNNVSGFKWIRAFVDNYALGGNGNSICTKFSGKRIPYDGTASDSDVHIVYTDGTSYQGNVLITVDDNDSGWGDSYTPTDDEVKAYMNGWVMYENVAPYNLYNGTGEKRWSKRYQGIGTTATLNFGAVVESASGVSVCPKEKAYGDITETYKLQYDRAKPVREEIDLFGDMTMPDGKVYVTMEPGFRFEKVKAGIISNVAYINDIRLGYDSVLNRKADKVIGIYEHSNGVYVNVFENWTESSDLNAYGNVKLSNSDLSESEILDKDYYIEYKTLSEENNTNVFDAQLTYKDDLINVVQRQGEKIAYQAEQLDIAKNKIEELTKEVVYEPTLLNGWKNYGFAFSNVEITEEANGFVSIKGTVKDGISTNGTAICKIPKPESIERFNVDSNGAFGLVVVHPDGDLRVQSVNNTLVSFNGIRYKKAGY